MYRISIIIRTVIRHISRFAGRDTSNEPNPKKTSQQSAFENALYFLEQKWEEGVTLNNLQDKMKEYSDQPYSLKWIRQLVENKYGDSLTIIKNVLIFRETSKSLLLKYTRELKDARDSNNIEAMKKKAIKLCSDLLKSDINCIVEDKDTYFSNNDMTVENMLNFLPDSLQYFVECLQPRRKKGNGFAVASIGQCIIQLVRNTTILCPLQVAFGADLHHQTGSRYLIDLSKKMGYSCGYNEILNFNQCAAGFDSDKGRTHVVESDIYSADNADVLMETIDGKNTLHVMGVIRSTLSKGIMTEPIQRKPPSIEKLQERISPFFYFHKNMVKELRATFSPWMLNETKLPVTTKLDMLRISASVFKPVPRYTGFMKLVMRGNENDKTHEIEFLPFIDLNPADMSATFTTLEFVISESKKHNQHPIVTFDQPLWWKSMLIKHAKELRVTILLGNFHTQMSFLGSIGTIMKNSGIEAVLGTVYEEPTVKKILQGKSFKRSMRAHSLLSTALKKIVVQQVSNSPKGYC